MSLMRSFQNKLASQGLAEVVRPENLRARKLKPQHSAAANTAQTFQIDIPTDRLIHAINISIGKSTTATGDDEQGTLSDYITQLELTSNQGSLKYLTGAQIKEICRVNKEIQATGFYKLYFTDPHIPEAKPLPSWLFSSLVLKITDTAPGASNYNHIFVSVIESEVPKGQDVSTWRILVERYLRWRKYGANTGWQDYDHERAYKIFGYLYDFDDNGTESDTIFNKMTLLGVSPGGEHRLLDELWFSHLKAMNTQAYQSTMAAGFAYAEFAGGYDSGQYRSLMTKAYIPSAGTNAGIRVVERFLL